MAGIINYYHSECGTTDHIYWRVSTDDVRLILGLTDDPHRDRAFDYGGDVSFDPAIRKGDHVTFLRLDSTCGIWLRTKDIADSTMHRALRRVRKNRLLFEEMPTTRRRLDGNEHALAAELTKNTAIVAEVPTAVEAEWKSNVPSTAASLFLSYSSRNVLLARQLFDDLREDAKADIWFDLNQPADQPGHFEEISKWLRSAIFSSRGLVLLLSQAALDSEWVMREVNWASEASNSGADFQIVVLGFHDIKLPLSSETNASIVDCIGLHRGVGIPEELYATIFGRVGRRQSLVDDKMRSFLSADEGGWAIDDFQSDSGTATNFLWSEEISTISWNLTYENGSRHETIHGAGLHEPVDLDIKPGDRIAWYQCHRRNGTRFGHGFRLAMRSADLAIHPDLVLHKYYNTLFIKYPNLQSETRHVIVMPRGEDAFGRLLSDVECKRENGSIPHITELMFYGDSDEDPDPDPGRRARDLTSRILGQRER